MKALITGISGMDAAHLAWYLLHNKKVEEVHGTTRPQSDRSFWRLERLGIKDGVNIIPADITDFGSIHDAIRSVEPDFVFNLAAQSHVGQSFSCPILTTQVNAYGAVNVFEACTRLKKVPRIYQASTSEMYGNQPKVAWGLDEKSLMHPISPYGAAKLYAHNMAKSYREQGYNISTGILFNHESPLRGSEFVTQKIIRGIKQFKLTGARIKLGNLDAERDWGYAPEYTQAMWQIINASPDEWVVATGECHSVSDFLLEACAQTYIIPDDLMEVADIERRPNDVDWLQGNATKIWFNLHWEPKVKFKELVGIMLNG